MTIIGLGLYNIYTLYIKFLFTLKLWLFGNHYAQNNHNTASDSDPWLVAAKPLSLWPLCSCSALGSRWLPDTPKPLEPSIQLRKRGFYPQDQPRGASG